MQLRIKTKFIGDAISYEVNNDELVINIDDEIIISTIRFGFHIYPVLEKLLTSTNIDNRKRIAAVNNDINAIKPKRQYGIFKFENTHYSNIYFIAQMMSNEWQVMDIYYPITNHSEMLKKQLRKSLRSQINYWLHNYMATPIYQNKNLIEVVHEYDDLIRQK